MGKEVFCEDCVYLYHFSVPSLLPICRAGRTTHAIYKHSINREYRYDINPFVQNKNNDCQLHVPKWTFKRFWKELFGKESM